MARFYYDWDQPGAEREFSRALSLGPGLASVHHSYAWYLGSLGRMEDAVAVAETAVRLDPASFRARHQLGWFYFEAGRYEEVIRALRETLEMEPQMLVALWYLHLSYVQLGKEREAVEAGRQWMATGGASPDEIAAIAHPDPRQSLRRIHVFNLRRLLAGQAAGYTPEHHLVLAHAQVNEIDEALRWLERGLTDRSRWLLPLLAKDPRLDAVRRDPRYREILRQAGPPRLRAD